MPIVRLRTPALLLVLVALVLGLLGAVPASAATPAPAPTPTARAALAIAATLEGRPYRWGATGPTAFDCSGYVRYVYAKAGKALPRTSQQQFAAVKKVPKTQKQVGDLIFTMRGGRIGHVGIYAGGGRFWHAPRAGDVVKLAKIYTPDYRVGRL